MNFYMIKNAIGNILVQSDLLCPYFKPFMTVTFLTRQQRPLDTSMLNSTLNTQSSQLTSPQMSFSSA